MPITKITIELVPPKNAEQAAPERKLIYDGNTKQWTSSEGGLFPGEIKLIAGIDDARSRTTV